jgi:Family of unknown function (DUF6334)
MNVLAESLVTTDPMLLPPRDEPYILKNVFEKIVHGCRDEIVLDLGDCCLRIGVDINYDTLLFRFQSRPFRHTKGWVSLRNLEPWKKCTGKECAWTWLAVNQQGYLDTALISFDGIEPSIMLQGIASSVEVFTVAPAKEVAVAKTGRNGRPKVHH